MCTNPRSEKSAENGDNGNNEVRTTKQEVVGRVSWTPDDRRTESRGGRESDLVRSRHQPARS